jgi:zinc transporter ZupT
MVKIINISYMYIIQRKGMSDAPYLYAGLTLLIALTFGLLPIYSSIKEHQDRLKMFTSIAAGIIIASAMLVVIPEGYELATSEEAHGEEMLAGSIALVLLEVNHGDINETQAIDEIEDVLGGHEEHEEDNHGEEASLKETVMHAIEEFEAGELNATAALEEIENALEAHDHESEDEHDEHASVLLLGGALLGGFVFMLILEGSGIGHAVHEEHHDHDHEHGHGHVHHNDSGWMVVLGLTLHSATDGLAIGAAAATGSIALTATVALAVLIHKAPAAFSLGVFSMHERKERKDSIRDVAIFALATPIMMMVAYLALADLDIHLIGLAMLFSAGTFLYVATVDTLPDIHNMETGKNALFHVLIGAVGLTLVLLGADAAGLLEHAH